MAPTLNQEDIQLLKQVFATKEEINSRFNDMESVLVKSFTEVETRLRSVEEELGLEPTN